MNFSSVIVSLEISPLGSPPLFFSVLNFAHYAYPVKGNSVWLGVGWGGGSFQRTFVISASLGGRRASIRHWCVLKHCVVVHHPWFLSTIVGVKYLKRVNGKPLNRNQPLEQLVISCRRRPCRGTGRQLWRNWNGEGLAWIWIFYCSNNSLFFESRNESKVA